MNKASLDEKFALINEQWRPKVVTALNGQEVKLVRFAGVFPGISMKGKTRLFLVSGRWRLSFVRVPLALPVLIQRHGRSPWHKQVTLRAGEFCVVPRGVEHRTMADAEAEVLVFEPAETRNTGNIVDDQFTAP